MMHGMDTFKRSLDDAEVYKRDRDVGDSIILHKNGDLHHLNVDLLPLKNDDNYVKKQATDGDNQNKQEEEIQIALHLRKKDKYVQAKDSSTKIYQFHQVLPNFYLRINKSLQQVIIETSNFSERSSLVKSFTRMVLGPQLAYYRNHSKVLVYQHDSYGYATRDCFLTVAIEKNLYMTSTPLNAIYRKNWEKRDHREREKYDILYGGLSFGVCEGHSQECLYFVMITHPLDRLLQTYWLCRNRINSSFCQFLHTENITNIYDYVEQYGSAFFHKLLYYSRHCRLIGDHEMCIHDNKIYFVLSPEEKAKYLIDILQNLERWFGVIGIAEELQTSLNLISGVTGLDFTKCLSPEHVAPKQFYKFFHKFHNFSSVSEHPPKAMTIDGMSYSTIRELLLNDTRIINWLSADMEIYNKLVELFHIQVSVYNNMKRLMLAYYNPSSDPHHSHHLGNEVNNTKTSDVFWNATTTLQPVSELVNKSTTADQRESFTDSGVTMTSSQRMAIVTQTNTNGSILVSRNSSSSALRSLNRGLPSSLARNVLTRKQRMTRHQRIKNGRNIYNRIRVQRRRDQTL